MVVYRANDGLDDRLLPPSYASCIGRYDASFQKFEFVFSSNTNNMSSHCSNLGLGRTHCMKMMVTKINNGKF